MDTEGKFSGLQGSIQFNPADLKTASFSVSVDANTVSTDIGARDNNLRTEKYLDTKKFPRISILSKQITATAKADVFLAKVSVTIKGITKDISIPFTVVTKEEGLVFTGAFRINRHDFKIGAGNVFIADSLEVVLSVLGKKN